MSTECDIYTKPKSKDLARQIGRITSSITFWISWIFGMPFCFLYFQIAIKLNSAASTWSWALTIAAASIAAAGVLYEMQVDFVQLDETASPEAWIKVLDENFESYLNGWHSGLKCKSTPDYDTNHIQDRKRAFVEYLTGSPWGYPSPFSVTMRLFGRCVVLLWMHVTLRWFCMMPGAFRNDGCLGFGAVIVENLALLVFIASFLLGRQTQWYSEMGSAAQKIRKRCKGTDMEGGKHAEHQLGWWIENILQEQRALNVLHRGRNWEGTEGRVEEKTGLDTGRREGASLNETVRAARDF